MADTPPYGKCNDCGITLQTQEISSQHHMDTIPVEPDADGLRRSHSTQVITPTREENIQHEITSVVSDALDDAMDALDEIDATEEEVSNALRIYGDFHSAWEEYNND